MIICLLVGEMFFLKGEKMNIREMNTEVSFTGAKTLEEAKLYVERTLRDASRMNIDLTWGFDEAQGGGFHNNWTASRFLQCVEKLLENSNA